ncbi:MAG TPA: tetratricopeptide repeat protein, partial [Geobacteraceae bacterium]
LPLVGIFIVIVWWGGGLLGSWQYRQEVLGAVAVGWLVLLGAVARQQVGYWKDSETLFRRALAVTTDNFVMHHNLGNELERQGRLAEAVAEHGRAVALRPFSAESHYSLANALYRQGQYEAAVTSYWQAIRFRPDYVAAHNNLGVAYHALGRRAEAIQQYRVALRLDPADARARQNLQDILAEEGSAP